MRLFIFVFHRFSKEYIGADAILKINCFVFGLTSKFGLKLTQGNMCRCIDIPDISGDY